MAFGINARCEEDGFINHAPAVLSATPGALADKCAVRDIIFLQDINAAG